MTRPGSLSDPPNPVALCDGLAISEALPVYIERRGRGCGATLRGRQRGPRPPVAPGRDRNRSFPRRSIPAFDWSRPASLFESCQCDIPGLLHQKVLLRKILVCYTIVNIYYYIYSILVLTTIETARTYTYFVCRNYIVASLIIQIDEI